MDKLLYVLKNFFTHKDFLDREMLIGTMFTPLHFIMSAIWLALVIGLAILLCKKGSDNTVKKTFIILWAVLVSLEVTKILWETFSGRTVSFEVFGMMPLYPCSIIMYALPFAIWGKNIVKKCACGYVCTLGVLGATVNFFYPVTVLPNYSAISFAGFHTMLYHGAMLFCALAMLLTGYHSYRCEKWYELILPSVPSLIVSIPTVIVDYALGVDYMWFRGTSFFLPAIFGNTPKPVITVIIYALYIIVPALFYLPSFIKNTKNLAKMRDFLYYICYN